MNREAQKLVSHAENCVIEALDMLPADDPRRQQIDKLLVEMANVYHLFDPKKYKVTACYYTYCTAVVAADTKDQAYKIARDMSGDSFKQSGDKTDWHINNIEEITE